MRLLVPLDLSTATERVLQATRAVARDTGASVWLLHVAAPDPAFVGYVLDFVHPSRRGSAFGGILAAFDTGIGTGSIGVGWLAQHLGFRLAFGAGALLSAFSIPYFLWAERRFLVRGGQAPAAGEPAPGVGGVIA